jgi:hypothetical protein
MIILSIIVVVAFCFVSRSTSASSWKILQLFSNPSEKRTFFVVWPALPPNTRCAWLGLVGGDGDFFLFFEDFLIHDSRRFMIF